MADSDEIEVAVQQPAVSKRIHFCRILAYGVGHFHNDMCASMWFTYLLIFTTRVLGFSSSVAGNLILIGQITDAICTPLVGFESDRNDIHPFCLKYGRRKIWHLIGFICVTCSFAFLFIECFGCTYQKTSEFVELFYYVPFVIVFQFGWACVQISHLALIPELSTCQHERATLNGVRYAFTVLANMAVFALVYFFIGLVNASHKNVTHNDGPSFAYVAVAVTILGCIFSLIFHAGTKEVEHSKLVAKKQLSEPSNGGLADNSDNGHHDSLALKQNHMRWSDWFNVFDFYLMAVLYMATRIFGNVAQTYLPLYVLETQHFEKTYIAIIPMVVYLSSFVTSSILSFRAVSRYIPRKFILLLGVFLGVGSCVWMWFHELHTMVYAVSVLLGMASTILLVVSLSLIADLINDNTESGAFVYGSMSFMDKISTGIAIQIVQSLQPNCIDILLISRFIMLIILLSQAYNRFSSRRNMPCINLDYYFRGVMVYVPGAALVIIFCALMIIWPRNVGERKNINDSTKSFDSIEDSQQSRNTTPDEEALLG